MDPNGILARVRWANLVRLIALVAAIPLAVVVLHAGGEETPERKPPRLVPAERPAPATPPAPAKPPTPRRKRRPKAKHVRRPADPVSHPVLPGPPAPSPPPRDPPGGEFAPG
jgi:hypothetical protein